MKKIYALMGLMLMLCTLLAAADSYVTWDNVYTNTSGLKTLSTESCGGVGNTADWNIVTWTDDSVNTSNCIDQIRCRVSEDGTTWGAYSVWKTSGLDVGKRGIYIGCQLNLSVTAPVSGNCSVSDLQIGCGGYHSSKEYTAIDAGVAGIDLVVEIIGGLAVLAGLATILWLIYLYKRNH